MAKKAVATFKDKTAKVAVTKVIVPIKNEKTGAYSFKEEIMLAENVSNFIKENTK